MLAAETPPPPTRIPDLIAQGTADVTVDPASNTLLQQEWCAAGVDLTMLWLGGVDHSPSRSVAAPMVVRWFADRFVGLPAGPASSPRR